MKLIKLFLFAFLICTNIINAQYDYARAIVDTLASSHMKGRGYVENGDRIAAKYIASEFEKMKLARFSPDYLHEFHVSVNTIRDSLLVITNGTTLAPGIDYLISPDSPSCFGKFKTVIVSEEILIEDNGIDKNIKKCKGKFLVITPALKELSSVEKKKVRSVINLIRNDEHYEIKGILIYTTDKLFWYGATYQSKIPLITAKYTTENESLKTIDVIINSAYHAKYKTQNVIGYIEGSDFPDSVILLSAHYDHLGQMGNAVYFPGANDNASGVAMLLNLAKHFSLKENKPKYTLLFVAFGAEEIGLLGSKHYTDYPALPLKSIKFLVNFDLAGTGDDGIKVVNGSVYKKEFWLLQQLNTDYGYLKSVQSRGAACNSDHCMFHKKNVPCVYIYTLGGIDAYHDIFDKAETLPLTYFHQYWRLMVDFISGL